jgi:hypothetical protein
MTEKKVVPEHEEIELSIKAMMEKEHWCAKWFETYNRASWNSFVKDYARFKYLALTYPKLYLDRLRPKVTEFNEFAFEILKHIQQKKLFNLQCEWRAERIDLPGIEICYDFKLVSEAVMKCPFIPPVTWEEVQAYIDFLKSANYEFQEEYPMGWQNYEDFVERDDSGYATEELPEWYEFYDLRFGTGFLMQLPDIRGEKERHYMKVYCNQPSEKPATPPKPPTPEQQAIASDYAAYKPTLFGADPKTFMEFASHFEDEETFKILQSHAKQKTHRNDFEELDEYYDYLKTIPGDFPFMEANDWKDAIILTVETYKREQYAKALPRIWRQYRKKTGDDMEANAAKYMRTYKIDYDALDPYKIRDIDIKRILGGRKILGEPENFDF